MGTAEHHGKGMVFQAHRSELQARICHVCAVKLWASYLPTYLLLRLVLPTRKCLLFRTAVRPKNGLCQQLEQCPPQHSVQVHALPSLWILPVLCNNARPAHRPSGTTAMVKIVCFLSPWVLLFNSFVFTHLKSERQSGLSHKPGFVVRVWAHFI